MGALRSLNLACYELLSWFSVTTVPVLDRSSTGAVNYPRLARPFIGLICSAASPMAIVVSTQQQQQPH